MIRAVPSSEPGAFRDARAEAWCFALACLAENRREMKEAAGPRQADSLEDARERIKDARTHADST